MPTIYALREEIRSGNKSYPIFVGFLSADEILEIAEAPHFTKFTSNEEIASKLDVPPMKDWQRPLIDEKIDDIRILFDDSGEFMPNPVLLSENVLSANSSNISLNRQLASGGAPTMIWEIDVQSPQQEEEKPLWILDGQHRIKGLAESKQADNHIPIVLLLNQQGNFYVAADLAKIFAQVTTQATKLNPLHNEWLTYAFHLDSYDDSETDYEAHRNAMRCVARLCSTPQLGEQRVNNAFLNKIQFNHDYKTATPDPGGFSYDCIELKKLIYRYYYNAATMTPRLPSGELAVQLCFAHNALQKVIQEPKTRTVFFGTPIEFGQKIMQDAFLVGVMSYLLDHDIPSNWTDVFKDLAFDRTNWDFSTWVGSLSGPAQTMSRRIALNVFARVFRDTRLPAGVDNLADYLRGDGAKVKFSFSTLTGAGRPSAKNRNYYELVAGTKSTSIKPRVHVKIDGFTPNIGKVEVTDKQRPLISYRINRGLKLDASEHTNPLMLTVAMHHYGGTMSSAEFSISW